jgi:hypothetical protein
MYAPISGTGDGTAPVVNITFEALSNSHIKAAVEGVPVTFTWTGASQVTFDAPVVAGSTWIVFRDTPIDVPLVDFTDGSYLTEADLDTSQKQLLFRQQEQVAAGVGSSPNFQNVLKGELSDPSGASLVGFAAYSSSTGRTAQDKFRETVSVLDFGAKGDGVTDDHAAFAAAVAAARGKRLIVPKGNYVINTDGGSIMLEEVAMVGEGVLDGANTTLDQGSNLFIKGVTNGAFKVRRGVRVEGLGFYYPDQADSATPTAYPATFAFDFTGTVPSVQFVRFHRNVVFNAYRWIESTDAAGNIGHVNIEGNFIGALNRAIYIARNLEHIRITRNNFTLGLWTASTEAGARGYMRANATAIQVDQSDGLEVTDNLIFGHLNGVLLAATGLTQFQKIAHNKFDQTRYAIKATGAGNFTGQVVGNTFWAANSLDSSLQGRSITIDTSGVQPEGIAITGNLFAAATEEHLYTAGDNPDRKITVSGNVFRGWAQGKASGTYGALNVNGALTNVMVSGSAFRAGAATQSGIKGALDTLTVTGSIFDSPWRAIDVTAAYLTGSGNAAFNTGDATSDVYTATNVTWGPNRFDKPQAKGPLALTLAMLGNYADDAAAAAAGVQVGGFYRNGSAIQVRAA